MTSPVPFRVRVERLQRGHFPRLALLGFLWAALPDPSWSDTARINVQSTLQIENERGESRILLVFENREIPTAAGISSAILRAPLGAPIPTDSLWVCPEVVCFPVTTRWSPESVDWTRGWETPGGDFDSGIRARGRLGCRSDEGEETTELTLDVTALLKETIGSDGFGNGFLITRGGTESRNLDAVEASLLSRIGEGTIEVSYKSMGIVDAYPVPPVKTVETVVR